METGKMMARNISEGSVLCDIRGLLSAHEALGELAERCYEGDAAMRLHSSSLLVNKAFQAIMDDIMLHLATWQAAAKRAHAELHARENALGYLQEAFEQLADIALPEWVEDGAAVTRLCARIAELHSHLAAYDQRYGHLFEDLACRGELAEFYVMTAKLRQSA